MKKSGYVVFNFMIATAICACSTHQKGNMAFVISSYRQGEEAVHQVQHRDEAMKMQLRLEKAATLIADCLLTLDFLAEGRFLDSNRKSFGTHFGY